MVYQTPGGISSLEESLTWIPDTSGTSWSGLGQSPAPLTGSERKMEGREGEGKGRNAGTGGEWERRLTLCAVETGLLMPALPSNLVLLYVLS